jgi:hypothetical protein
MSRANSWPVLRTVAAILVVLTQSSVSTPGAQPSTASAPADFDAIVRDLYRGPLWWEEALDLKAPDMVIDTDTFIPALTAVLSMDRLKKLKTDDWDRLSVLVRLVALKNIREARSLLRERMYDPNVPLPVRRELAEAFARTASDAEIVEMLDSGADVLTATAIDWAGDRQAPPIRSRVDRMLAASKKYWGTDTGSAIGEVGLLRLLIKQWEAAPNLEARLDIVFSSPSFMFDGRNRHWRNAPRNTALGRWMRSRFQELYAADPQLVAAELRKRGKTNDWFLYIKQELAKPRSTFFARTQPALTSRPGPG